MKIRRRLFIILVALMAMFIMPGLKVSAEENARTAAESSEVSSGGYGATIFATTTKATGLIYITDEDYEPEVVSAFIEIGGKQYNCTISEISSEDVEEVEEDDDDEDDDDDDDDVDDDDDEDDDDEDDDDDDIDSEGCYMFRADYSVQTVGTEVKLGIKDSAGVISYVTAKVANITPSLDVDIVSTITKKITGATAPGASVKVKIGKKTYTGKAAKDGSFAIKIKAQKAGTKIGVTVAIDGYSASKTVKVVKKKGYCVLKSDLQASDTTLKLDIHGGAKGDVLKIKIGDKSYTKKMKKSKNVQTVTVAISKPKAGAKASVKLIDKKGKNKDNISFIVSAGDKIKSGMSTAEASLTSWGKPVKKQSIAQLGAEEWIFVKGTKLAYAYIIDDEVIYVQTFD